MHHTSLPVNVCGCFCKARTAMRSALPRRLVAVSIDTCTERSAQLALPAAASCSQAFLRAATLEPGRCRGGRRRHAWAGLRGGPLSTWPVAWLTGASRAVQPCDGCLLFWGCCGFCSARARQRGLGADSARCSVGSTRAPRVTPGRPPAQAEARDPLKFVA